MISGIDLNATVDYSLKEDKQDPTIWKLGALPSSAMSKIAARSTKGEYMDQMVDLVRQGLKGWENFKVADKEVAFEQDKEGRIPMSLIDIIPMNALMEIGTELLNVNKLSPGETKN